MASTLSALSLPSLSLRIARHRQILVFRSNPLLSSASSSNSINWVRFPCSVALNRRIARRHLENSVKTENFKDFCSDDEEGHQMSSNFIDRISENAPLWRQRVDLHSGLKLVLLSGLLTFQGCQHAGAIAEISSGLQANSFLGDLNDIGTGFTSAFLLIFFSELGDKTFFIAALLAARNSGLVVFLGTFGALAVMTVISVVLGRTFHYVDDLLPFRFGETDLPIDDIAAVCLLVYFGVSTLIDASSSGTSKSEEEKEEAELAIADVLGNGAGIVAAASTVFSTFALVFVAEWGDKSFFSTIALAAASSPLGVVGGAFAGHAVATALACVGGSLLGTFLSEKLISYVGGILFLVFAAVTLSDIIN
ncbi:GDT1-like protein 1, chloroplastic [Wolffia australiana]